MKKIIFYLLLTITGVSTLGIASASTVNIENQLQGREQNFEQFVQQTLEPFWHQNAFTSFFINSQNLEIHYAYVLAENAKASIVISPGRVEGYLKYKELIFDFVEQGYSVFVIDHQGQGLSSRRLENKHKGYVESFDDYVSDLHQFIEQVVVKHEQGERFLVSHSMGGAIGLRYIQMYPAFFSKAVFSSPMWALDSGPLPKTLAKGLVSSIAWAHGLVSEDSPYFVGGKNYQPTEFNKNVLTHSKVRYQYFRSEYEKQPQLQLGGVTIDWIDQSVKSLDIAYEQLDKVKNDVMVLQAGFDKVIDNQGQDLFCERLKELGNPCLSGGPIVIDNAEHELFIEHDQIRTQVLAKLLMFLSSDES